MKYHNEHLIHHYVVPLPPLGKAHKFHSEAELRTNITKKGVEPLYVTPLLSFAYSIIFVISPFSICHIIGSKPRTS